MSDNNPELSREEILDNILNGLQSDNATNRLQAVAKLQTITYASAAIRNHIEQLALHDANEEVRKNALAALDLPNLRNVQNHLNKIKLVDRYLLIEHVNHWEKSGLLGKSNADVIRRRYDFDLAPPPAQPKPTPVQLAVAAPRAAPAVPLAPSAAKTESPKPQEPAGPRPTLLQTLLSEASIKIALYLGAFFVVASAAILGALVEAARLPVLITGTLIFGGLSVAIKKRLPQPSFALFIVFSFLLPITTNVLEESFEFSPAASAVYCVIFSLFMWAIWAGSTWLYESRLFSITAFVSTTIAFYRIGDIFQAEPELYATLSGLAALAGLAGTWVIKKWKDKNFALPLFLAAQAVQGIVLAASMVIFGARVFDPSTYPLWHLASVFTWGFALAFYVVSESLFPFIFFPWLAALTLIPMPWFLAAALDTESLASAVIFSVWGLFLSIASEVLHRMDADRKYSLPVLLSSIPVFALAMITGFAYDTALGLLVALSIAVIYGVLHFLRARAWLWTLAILNFVIAYFAFFDLPVFENTRVFFGYPLLGLSLLFLLPDLLLKSDFKDNLAWRLPPRIYGALFTTLNFILFAPAQERPFIHTAVVFGVYAVFLAIYALKYQRPLIGYVAALALPISVLYGLGHLGVDLWLEALTAISVVYYFAGFALQKNEARKPWRDMLVISGLTLGSIISLVALMMLKEYGGWFIAVIGALFIIEMHVRKEGLLEIGVQTLFPAAVYLIVRDFQPNDIVYILVAVSLTWLTLDLIFSRTFKEKREIEWFVKGLAALFILISSVVLLTQNNSEKAAVCFAIYTVFFIVYALVQRKAIHGYIAAAYLPLTIVFTLDHFNLDAWLPVLTGLAILYFVIGFAIRTKEDWSLMLRNSALALGTLISLGALITLKETGGWYALVAGLLFATEMYLRRDGWLEIGIPAMFNIGAFLILRDINMEEPAYHLLVYSLAWLATDLLAHITFPNPRPVKWLVRGIGVFLTAINFPILFFAGTSNDASIATIGFGSYALFFLLYSLLHKQPNLLYAFTGTLPLFTAFLFRQFDIVKWVHPVIVIAVMYYALGYFFRRNGRAAGWDTTLLFSGLGLGTFVSIAAPFVGGLDAAIPVAIAATLWAIEAFARRNVWLGFPANALYLFAYFIILIELKQDEPQFFSMGAALLGLIQHYLLTRAGGKTSTFITGMISQLILLGTTYIEMVEKNELVYFFVLFFQAMAVLTYGVFIRSRSLTFFPIGFLVLGPLTLLYSALKEMSTVVIIGCAGIILLMLGVLAVVMRERITKLGEHLSTWQA